MKIGQTLITIARRWPFYLVTVKIGMGPYPSFESVVNKPFLTRQGMQKFLAKYRQNEANQ